MRGAFLCAWLLIPAAVAAYHLGPGQERLVLDEAAAHLRAAETHVASREWSQAAVAFDAALALVPADRAAEVRRLRIERAKAQLKSGKLPEAYDDLTLLTEELRADSTASPELVADARQALASAQYYLTWLMRLEGEPREAWEHEIEAARQNYRLLAQQAESMGDKPSEKSHREDLESAIRLARMDLSELQALPLPSQCQGCCSGDCKCKGKSKGKNRKKGENKAEDVRGASSGPPPDDRGS